MSAFPRAAWWRHWFDDRFRTPAAIYGLIVYSALLLTTSDHHESVGEVVLVSATTLIIFFVAHVFAQTLADHGRKRLWASTAGALEHSAGMLYAAVPPTIALLLAWWQGASTDDATEAALWTAVAVLGVLGYLAYARTGSSRGMRIVGAIGTAMLGALIAVLEYAFH